MLLLLQFTQGLENFFCKGPEGQYFRLWGQYDLSPTVQIGHCSIKASRDVNEWAWLCCNKTLFTKQSVGCGLLIPDVHTLWLYSSNKFWLFNMLKCMYHYIYKCEKKVKVKSLSRVRLCDPMDCSPPGFSVHGIFQARILEWVAISFSRGSPWPRDWTWVSCSAGRLFTIGATRESLL